MDGVHITSCAFAGRLTKCDGNVLVLGQPCAWDELLVGSPYVYVVQPSERGDYLVRAVSERCGKLDMTLPFPPDWRGASPEKLRKMTKINDLVSCHPCGGLCVATSLDGAVEAARLSLMGDWHHCFNCPWPCPSCVE